MQAQCRIQDDSEDVSGVADINIGTGRNPPLSRFGPVADKRGRGWNVLFVTKADIVDRLPRLPEQGVTVAL